MHTDANRAAGIYFVVRYNVVMSKEDLALLTVDHRNNLLYKFIKIISISNLVESFHQSDLTSESLRRIRYIGFYEV